MLSHLLFAQGAFVPSCAFFVSAEVPFAHGAAVPLLGGGGAGVRLAHGAFVGWFGPLGTPAPAPRAVAQGAAVTAGIPPAGALVPVPAPAVAHGAAVPTIPPGTPLLGMPVEGSAIGSRNAGCGLAVGAVLDGVLDFG